MFILNPSKITARQTQVVQANRVKKSIFYLYQECIEKLKINDDEALLMASEIPKIKLLSPEIHFFHYALQNAMRNQDATGAKKYLSVIKNKILEHALCEDCISISSISNSEWENFVIAEAKRLAAQDCGRIAKIEPIFESELALAKDQVCAALCFIARHDSEMFDEIKQHLHIIKLFQGEVTMGFTDTRILGAMLIKVPTGVVSPVMYFVEHIIHEASHIHLNCLMAIDTLILNSADERFISPLRADPRPMVGVFHATYVSARIARFFMKIYLSTGANELLQPLAETLDETIRGVSEIEKNAKLTPSGHLLLASIKGLID